MITSLSKLITDFFMVHLADERNASQHTVHCYRDTFKMLLNFAADYHNRTIDRLCIEYLSVDVILQFLSDLETSRGNSVRTRNVRLAAIHSFFRYVLSREPVVSSLQKRTYEDNGPIFINHSGQKLSRHGVRYLLKKYLTAAQQKMPSLARCGISPHTLRHTKAMHLLQSGLPLITIKDILGHADVKSTEVYVQIDLEMKRKALEHTGTPSRVRKSARHITPDLLKWLESL